jgi:hypothetical protein
METWSEGASSDAPGVPRRSATAGLHNALDAVLQALGTPVASVDVLRRVVVRYGALAREQAMQLEEMLATLTRGVLDVLELRPSSNQAELLAFVQWWAMHGYHRAD